MTGIALKVKPLQLGALLQHRDRLLAVRAVVIDEADLLALQLVDAAVLLGDVLDGDVGRGPVGADGEKFQGNTAPLRLSERP